MGAPARREGRGGEEREGRGGVGLPRPSELWEGFARPWKAPCKTPVKTLQSLARFLARPCKVLCKVLPKLPKASKALGRPRKVLQGTLQDFACRALYHRLYVYIYIYIYIYIYTYHIGGKHPPYDGKQR